MEQTGQLEAARAAEPADLAGDGHPGLERFDEVRRLLAQTGLPPEPEVYELLYLHVSGADVALSREIEQLVAAGELSSDAIKGLRRAHLGDIAATEVLALVEAAQESANQLAERLDRGHADLRAYDAAIAAEDEALSVSRTAHELADLVQRLRRANATMMAANRRLEADIQAATLETGRLLDRLETAERSARTDPLTGLLNRRGVMEALKRAQARALRDGEPLSVALVDIDHFKRVNDQWGHAIGDEVLRCVGGHLQAHARRMVGDAAFAGRHGGEEFLVALPGHAVQQAAAVLDNSRAILARQLLRRADDGASLGRVTFSAGVAQLRPADSPDSLIDRADAALYTAKRSGRDRVLPERPEAAG
jgi:diguanylate cyclase